MLPLLYDAVREAGTRAGDPLPTIPCYELTSLLPVLPSWEEESHRPVCRRPPHDALWAEWQTDGKHTADAGSVHAVRLTSGVLLLRGRPPEYPADGSPADARVRAAEAYYMAVHFVRVDAFRPRPPGRDLTGRVIAAEAGAALIFSNDYRRVESVHMLHRESDGRPLRSMHGAEVAPHTLGALPCVSELLPVLFAFALLNCKNVAAETVEPSALRQRDRKRAGKPRLTDYRVLRIVAPRPAAERHAGPAEDTGRHVRLHICAGHFRTLRAERFSRKRGETIWVNAHTRGSADLGTVAGPRKIIAR
jgi:hypothetical protein